MGVSIRVTRWADVLEQACADVGADEMELAVMLALVATESSGDDRADNGTFRGLLQIASPYLLDARAWLKRHRPELLREVPSHKDGLLGDGRASALVVAAYMRRYAMRHDWNPHRIAATHKGGAGTARTIDAALERGMTLREALEHAEEVRRVPNLVRYVLAKQHFDGHYRDYRAWVEGREGGEEPAPVCEPVEEDPLELIARALRMLAQQEASS